MICPAEKRSRETQTYLYQRCRVEAGIARAYALMQAFLLLVQAHWGHDVEARMAEATQNGIEGLARFARGRQHDVVTVKAGRTLVWSTVTEGQIHRLRLVKRQGYGRARFARLRQGVLQAA
jgi:transposase